MHAYSQSAQTWITQFYLQSTPSLPFLRKRSPDGAAPSWGSRHRIAAYYSFIDPEGMKSWVGLVGWPIADGLHGHPSATGQAQDGKSPPAKDRHSTAVPHNQSIGTVSHKLCENGWTDRDAIWNAKSGGLMEHALYGDVDAPWEGAFGMSGRLESIVKHRILGFQ